MVHIVSDADHQLIQIDIVIGAAGKYHRVGHIFAVVVIITSRDKGSGKDQCVIGGMACKFVPHEVFHVVDAVV